MAQYDVSVTFSFSTTVRVEAADAIEAEQIVMTADHDQVADLNGKSYADVDESTRVVTLVVPVI